MQKKKINGCKPNIGLIKDCNGGKKKGINKTLLIQ